MDQILIRYKFLLEAISKLESLEKEGVDFEIYYKNQHFFKRQFDLKLNQKRTAYKFGPIELKDRIHGYKNKLRFMIREYFFYHHVDEEIQRVSKENEDILNVATYTVKRLYKSEFMPIIIKRYDRLEGDLTEVGLINLYGTRHKSESLNEITGYGNFYLDYVGSIFPNGETEFKGVNLSGSAHISGTIRQLNQYPSYYTMSRNGHEWRISANMKTGGELPYYLKGFSIVLSNCNSEKFYKNAMWLEKKYGEFKMKFAAVYT